MKIGKRNKTPAVPNTISLHTTTDGRTDRQTDRQTSEWMYKWMDGWMNGCFVRMCVYTWFGSVYATQLNWANIAIREWRLQTTVVENREAQTADRKSRKRPRPNNFVLKCITDWNALCALSIWFWWEPGAAEEGANRATQYKMLTKFAMRQAAHTVQRLFCFYLFLQ